MSLCTLLLASSYVQAADFPANPVSKSGYSLIFQEEFDSASLDSAKWMDYYLPHWASASTLQNGKAQFTISNGVMRQYLNQGTGNWSPYDGTVKISSIQTFNKPGLHRFNGSAVNHTHSSVDNNFNGFTFKYGYMEMRAKFSNAGGGGHQAWWLVGTQADDTDNDGRNTAQAGEIDIVETFFSHGDKWQAVVHPNGDPNLIYYFNGLYSSSENLRQEFHVYAMDWTPNGLKFYLDNQLVFQAGPGSAPSYEMGMLLGIYTDAGSGTANSNWPKEWEVDYVRVWQDNDGYEVTEPSSYRIRNRWTDQYLVSQSGQANVTYSASTQTDSSDLWQKVPTDGGYFILRNVATGNEMNIEGLTGVVQNSDVPNTYWSAQWKEVAVDGWVRLENRWRQADELHIEDQNGSLQYGDVLNTWWSSHWAFEPVQ